METDIERKLIHTGKKKRNEKSKYCCKEIQVQEEYKMMEGSGVIVECFVSEKGEKNGESNSPKSLSCSGIYLGSGLVLTHGTIATDILQHPASQSVLQVLGSGGWVVNGGCREKHVSKVHNLSSVNNLRVKGKSSEHSSLSSESQLSTTVSITQAKFQVILPVSNDNLVAQGLTDTSTSGNQSAANGPPHKQLTIKEWQNQDGDDSGYSCHNSQKLKNSNQGAERVSVYKESKQENEVNMSYPTNTHTLKLLTAKGTNQSLASKLQSLSQSYNTVPAHIERLLTVPSLRQKIEGLMPASEGWKFTEGEEDGKESDSVIDNIILSTFVVLRIAPSDSLRDECGKMLDETEVMQVVKKMLAQTSHVYKGATVYIESSPFGSLCPDVFLNSLSRGVINNATPPLLLTDARCILGSEGAPVFASLGQRPNLCAMVISPFFWRKGEWLGLSLLAAIQPILRTVLLSCSQSEDPPRSLPNPPVGTDVEEQGKVLMTDVAWTGDLESSEEMLMKGIEGSVVGVWGGDKWGSGVVVSSRPPLILTCAHVTQPAKHGRVTVVLSDGRKMCGQVLHQTQPVGPSTGEEGTNGVSIWDLAVVGVSQPLPPPLILSTHLPHTGPLVVGIVTCNIRDYEKKCVFPNINMAAPTPLVARIIDAFIKTLDPRVLHMLDVACPEASHLWSLSSAPQAHL